MEPQDDISRIGGRSDGQCSYSSYSGVRLAWPCDQSRGQHPCNGCLASTYLVASYGSFFFSTITWLDHFYIIAIIYY